VAEKGGTALWIGTKQLNSISLILIQIDEFVKHASKCGLPWSMQQVEGARTNEGTLAPGVGRTSAGVLQAVTGP